jgi:hypothetical protein
MLKPRIGSAGNRGRVSNITASSKEGFKKREIIHSWPDYSAGIFKMLTPCGKLI